MTQAPAAEEIHEAAGPTPPGAAWGGGADRSLSDLVWQLLGTTTVASARLAERLRLTPVDVEMLTLLMETEEDLGPVELSRRLGVTSAATTQSSARLVASGDLQRRAHPNDRRRQVLTVTPAGQDRVMAQLVPLLELAQQAGSGMDDAEQAVVRRYLVGLLDAYTAYITGAAPPA